MPKKSIKTIKKTASGENDDPLPLPEDFYCQKLLDLSKKKAFINIIMLFILIAEIAMPHRILANEANLSDNGENLKYPMELALSSGVYTFNDKYVPQEIELKKIAAKRKEDKKESDIAYVKTVTTTAYSSTVDQCDDTPFIAASGKRVFDGMVAANFLKFGTKVRIPDYFGNKIFQVEDRMNRRFQNRVDIWMKTRQEALNWGIRTVRIEVLK